MKPLPESFRKDGFDFKLVKRRGNVAIYEKSKPHHTLPGYEVGIIRSNPARIAFGKDIPASESWPCSEEWGIRAWTHINLARAMHQFAALEDIEIKTPRKADSP